MGLELRLINSRVIVDFELLSESRARRQLIPHLDYILINLSDLAYERRPI